MNELQKKQKFKNVLMLHNVSTTSGEEQWPNQFEKQKEHENENIGAVEAFK